MVLLYFSETVKSDEQQQLQGKKKLKASRNNEDLIQAYLYITAVTETRVSQAHTNIKTQLKEVEQQYFRNCGKLPTSKEILKDPVSKLLVDKLKHCKALVDGWKKVIIYK